MEISLSICSSLEHDGDELVQFQIGAKSKEFAGSTFAWGYASQLSELATCLAGFPNAGNVPVIFEFGGAKVGEAKLEFVTTDAAGHCGVWVTLDASYPASHNQRTQQASIFLPVEPAAIDRFASTLRAFSMGATHEAVLLGIAP